MKKMFLGSLLFGLMVNISFAADYKKGSVIESKDEISCSSSKYIEFAMQGVDKFSGQKYGQAMFTGWLSNADCNNITEGMDLKVVKTVPFQQTYAGKTQAVLVKLPTGMTTWVAR